MGGRLLDRMEGLGGGAGPRFVVKAAFDPDCSLRYSQSVSNRLLYPRFADWRFKSQVICRQKTCISQAQQIGSLYFALSTRAYKTAVQEKERMAGVRLGAR